MGVRYIDSPGGSRFRSTYTRSSSSGGGGGGSSSSSSSSSKGGRVLNRITGETDAQFARRAEALGYTAEGKPTGAEGRLTPQQKSAINLEQTKLREQEYAAQMASQRAAEVAATQEAARIKAMEEKQARELQLQAMRAEQEAFLKTQQREVFEAKVKAGREMLESRSRELGIRTKAPKVTTELNPYARYVDQGYNPAATGANLPFYYKSTTKDYTTTDIVGLRKTGDTKALSSLGIYADIPAPAGSTITATTLIPSVKAESDYTYTATPKFEFKEIVPSKASQEPDKGTISGFFASANKYVSEKMNLPEYEQAREARRIFTERITAPISWIGGKSILNKDTREVTSSILSGVREKSEFYYIATLGNFERGAYLEVKEKPVSTAATIAGGAVFGGLFGLAGRAAAGKAIATNIVKYTAYGFMGEYGVGVAAKIYTTPGIEKKAEYLGGESVRFGAFIAGASAGAKFTTTSPLFKQRWEKIMEAPTIKPEGLYISRGEAKTNIYVEPTFRQTNLAKDLTGRNFQQILEKSSIRVTKTPGEPKTTALKWKGKRWNQFDFKVGETQYTTIEREVGFRKYFIRSTIEPTGEAKTTLFRGDKPVRTFKYQAEGTIKLTAPTVTNIQETKLDVPGYLQTKEINVFEQRAVSTAQSRYKLDLSFVTKQTEFRVVTQKAPQLKEVQTDIFRLDNRVMESTYSLQIDDPYFKFTKSYIPKVGEYDVVSLDNKNVIGQRRTSLQRGLYNFAQEIKTKEALTGKVIRQTTFDRLKARVIRADLTTERFFKPAEAFKVSLPKGKRGQVSITRDLTRSKFTITETRTKGKSTELVTVPESKLKTVSELTRIYRPKYEVPTRLVPVMQPLTLTKIETQMKPITDIKLNTGIMKSQQFKEVKLTQDMFKQITIPTLKEEMKLKQETPPFQIQTPKTTQEIIQVTRQDYIFEPQPIIDIGGGFTPPPGFDFELEPPPPIIIGGGGGFSGYLPTGGGFGMPSTKVKFQEEYTPDVSALFGKFSKGKKPKGYRTGIIGRPFI